MVEIENIEIKIGGVTMKLIKNLKENFILKNKEEHMMEGKENNKYN